MAKARVVRSELRTSTVVAEWPLEARYFWILLWGYVDDYGRGKDNTKLIKADCFPLDDTITTEVIDEWLWLFAESGVIVRYTVDGCDFLAVKNWEEHQKVPHKGKDNFPDFIGENVVLRNLHESFMNDAGNTTETFTLKLNKVNLTKEFNNVEQNSLFDEFWNVYPRRQGKGKARESWDKAVKSNSPEMIIEAARAYASSPSLPSEQQFIPLPQTWLNQERWADDVAVKPALDPDWWMYPHPEVAS